MSLYLESVVCFLPRVPVQSVLLLLRNVNRKDVHHLTTLLVVSLAAAVASSLLGCYIFCTETQIYQSRDWSKFCSLPSNSDVMLTCEPRLWFNLGPSPMLGRNGWQIIASAKEAKVFPNITHLLLPKETVSFVSWDPSLRRNKTHCFPHGQSLSVLLYLPTQKQKKKLQKNCLLDAGQHTNLPQFQGAWPDHVRVKISSCCFPEELVSFVCP